jgi:hypothetical protein
MQVQLTAKMVGSAEILLDETETRSPPALYRTLPLFIDVDSGDESVIVRGVSRILVQASQYACTLACTHSTGDEIAVWLSAGRLRSYPIYYGRHPDRAQVILAAASRPISECQQSGCPENRSTPDEVKGAYFIAILQ